MRIAMDANALMMPVEFGVRVFEELDDLVSEYDAVVPAAVVAELEKLATGNGEEGTAASVGADLATRCETVETDASYADDALFELATTGGVDAVVTNDGPLKDRLLDAGVPVIHLRGRNQLTTTQP
jgi:rRNA-processing protein FCF1